MKPIGHVRRAIQRAFRARFARLERSSARRSAGNEQAGLGIILAATPGRQTIEPHSGVRRAVSTPTRVLSCGPAARSTPSFTWSREPLASLGLETGGSHFLMSALL